MDNLKYDLTGYRDWKELGSTGYVTVSCSDGSHVMRLVTNRDGEGLWKRKDTPFGREYQQIAGTCDFSLPGSEAHLRRLMRDEFWGMARMCAECGVEMPREFFYSRRD